MIMCYDGHVMVEGKGGDIIAEAACVLHEIHESAEKKFGKKTADEVLVLIGRLAVATDEDFKNDTMIEGLFERSDV